MLLMCSLFLLFFEGHTFEMVLVLGTHPPWEFSLDLFLKATQLIYKQGNEWESGI